MEKETMRKKDLRQKECLRSGITRGKSSVVITDRQAVIKGNQVKISSSVVE